MTPTLPLLPAYRLRQFLLVHPASALDSELTRTIVQLVTGAIVVADGGACLPAAMSLSLALGG